MNRVCYTTVSDLAICQRCPGLFAQKIHNGHKSVWRVGIKGNGEAYGSIFHKKIARPFYDAAAHSQNPLHLDIARSIPEGPDSLEKVIRENFFMPFLSENSQKLSSGQLIAIAKAVRVWVKAMCDYFINIPSLMNEPAKNMLTVFKIPEQKLKAYYELDEGKLKITGCYDALMFNPDRAEVRLLEFKGYRKSDVTVPLSQSLIYAWLIERMTGIIPSVQIIYLDEEDKTPDAFSPKTVSSMTASGLPELFRTAFDIISLRRQPKILRDENLCSICKFNKKCEADLDEMFKKKRPGASLINVLVFFLAAVMITAQVFFFFGNESETIKEERSMLQIRMRLENLVQEGKKYVAGRNDIVMDSQDYYTFFSNTKLPNDYNFPGTYWNDKYNLTINTLNYTLQERKILLETSSGWHDFDEKEWGNIPVHERVFSPMGPGYYLVRAYTVLPSGNSLMHQAIVHNNSIIYNSIISYEEIWY